MRSREREFESFNFDAKKDCGPGGDDTRNKINNMTVKNSSTVRNMNQVKNEYILSKFNLTDLLLHNLKLFKYFK